MYHVTWCLRLYATTAWSLVCCFRWYWCIVPLHSLRSRRQWLRVRRSVRISSKKYEKPPTPRSASIWLNSSSPDHSSIRKKSFISFHRCRLHLFLNVQPKIEWIVQNEWSSKLWKLLLNFRQRAQKSCLPLCGSANFYLSFSTQFYLVPNFVNLVTWFFSGTRLWECKFTPTCINLETIDPSGTWSWY